MSTKRVQISLQHQKEFDTAAPLVASFRNGPPPSPHHTDLTMEVFENPAKKQRLVLSSTDRIAYQGANFGYLSSTNDCASYAVGIYDKLTRRVQLCNIKQIYGMQQTIKGSTINVDENKGENKSFMEKKRDLVELFGSKKSKRIQKSMEENMVNVQSVSGAASITETLRKRINKASEEVKKRDGLASNVESAALVTRNAMLPPHNVDASTPDGVYNVRKFLDPSVLEALQMKAAEWLEQLQSSNVGDFTSANQLAALPTRLLLSMRTPYDKTKLTYLAYLHYQYELLHTSFPFRKSVVAFSEEKNIPIVIFRHLLQLFTDCKQDPETGYSSYLQPKPKKDKLILYMIVMALTINNFTLELTELGTDLKRSPTSLLVYCRQLGCSVEKVAADTAVYGTSSVLAAKKQAHRVVLTLPLQFPTVKRGGRTRR